MRVFYTSDLHLGHRLMLSTRGFGTIEEHDETVIGNWNKTISPEDTVWLLGDVAMRWDGALREKLQQLNGTIHLVTGNHDPMFPAHRRAQKYQAQWMDCFASIQQYAKRKIGAREFLLSHFPYSGDHGEDRYTQYRLRDEGMWLVHGHTHGKEKLGEPRVFWGPAHSNPPGWSWRGRQLHVGLDARDLKPVTEEQVLQEMRDADLANSLDIAPGG
jgi:calcineurin-like phosphoesterase family protein